MRCYSIDYNGNFGEGIEVTRTPGVPTVPMMKPYCVSKSTEVVKLDETLAKRIQEADAEGVFSNVTRIMRCGVEKTSDIWLVPPNAEDGPSALVACEFLTRRPLIFRFPKKHVGIEVEGKHNEFLRFTWGVKHDRAWRGESAFVQLFPGASISTFTKGLYVSGGKLKRQIEHKFTVQPDGSLLPSSK